MRYEKSGKSKEQFIEVVLAGAQVYVSKGSRAKGETEWFVKDKDERRYGWSGDVEKAVAFFEETKAGALKSGFVLVSEASPRIESTRGAEKADAARNEAGLALIHMKKAPPAEQPALLEKARAALKAWDEGLAAMNEKDRAGFLSLHGPDVESMRAKVK